MFTGTVEEALEPERRKTFFPIHKMTQFLYGQSLAEAIRSFPSWPDIPYDFNIFNYSRTEHLKHTYRVQPILVNNFRLSLQSDLVYLLWGTTSQMPGSVHLGMFTKCIDIMGSDDQKEQFLKKCRSFEIVGCYAQTELGHGSDVQNLETTATLDETKDQFIINTPTISATKYWPGDLGLSANWALVFAQLIIKGQKYGVHSFLVPIRDENMNPLPGIEVGDIGPKIGFYSKDNGYLIMNNIRIPRLNMLRKFIQVSSQGQISLKGNPKIIYATMMEIRKHIACTYPKVYAQGITIAARYSVFRGQFKSANQEIRIIDYQLQQQKIISRIAEYYAITSGGNYLAKLCSENFERVIKKEDFSLMAQTHACLCMCKSFYSQTILAGLEICRRACGGHGFSHYSGIPQLIQEYTANVTHEGQNTVLYLQTARYLLKSYKHSLTKKKSLDTTVQYIESLDFLMSKKCTVDPSDFEKWSLEDFRILLAQSVCYLLKCVHQKLMNKTESIPDSQILKFGAGIRFQQLAIAHVCYYTYTSFRDAIVLEKCQEIKQNLNNICALYGANLLITYGAHVVEGGFATNEHFSSLKTYKEVLLRRIRPQIMGLIDGMAVPDKLVRSALASGNPYQVQQFLIQNLLSLAKKVHINQSVPESGLIIKNEVQESLKPKL